MRRPYRYRSIGTRYSMGLRYSARHANKGSFIMTRSHLHRFLTWREALPSESRFARSLRHL